MRVKDKQALRRKIEKRGDKAMEKFKFEIATQTINELQVITAYVLQSEFGFGFKRLVKFLTLFHKVHLSVSKYDIRLSTLAEEVKDKTGLEYDLENMDWTDIKGREVQ